MALAKHNFRCEYDQTAFEAEIDDTETLYSPCPRCGRLANRIVGTFTMPLSMGCDPSFPTMWDKWARVHKQQTRLAYRHKKATGDIR
jgi:hypothetical protein